jgi:hypothetical protein
MNTSNSFRPNICLNLETGEAWFGAGSVYINDDTTGKFADGTITWNENGVVIIGGKAYFYPDGSGSLAGGNISWDSDGSLTINTTIKAQQNILNVSTNSSSEPINGSIVLSNNNLGTLPDLGEGESMEIYVTIPLMNRTVV